MLLTRRKFFVLSLGGATALAFSKRLPPEPVTRRAWALGSEASITVCGLPSAAADRAIDAAFREIDAVEEVMSLYRSDSQIVRLNRDRVLDDPHPWLRTVLSEAARTAHESDGAFDVTVQPLWSLFASCHKESRLPTDVEIESARRCVDWRQVLVTPQRVTLREPVQAITLNGIAQGFAADRAKAVLQRHGVTHALINTGEVAGLGQNPRRTNWTVGIQHPREPDAFVALTQLQGRSLATSGDYESRFGNDFTSHHILDPHTGRSPDELASVSIVAPSAMQADALSTAAMVLGADRTLTLIESLRDVDAFLVLKNGRTLRTGNFPCVEEASLV